MSKQVKLKVIPKTHVQMVTEWMKDPAFRAEYEALHEEYELIRSMLLARKRAGLTQKDVANKMGTKAPAVARLESLNASDKHSPSLRTLRNYARAVGCRLVTSLEALPQKASK